MTPGSATFVETCTKVQELLARHDLKPKDLLGFIKDVTSVFVPSPERDDAIHDKLDKILQHISDMRDNEPITAEEAAKIGGVNVKSRADMHQVRTFMRQNNLLQYQEGTPSRFVKRITSEAAN